MTKRIKPQGTVFFGARKRLIIARFVAGKAGNSRRDMYGKNWGHKGNPRGIGLDEIQHRGYLQKLAEVASRLLLRREQR